MFHYSINAWIPGRGNSHQQPFETWQNRCWYSYWRKWNGDFWNNQGVILQFLDSVCACQDCKQWTWKAVRQRNASSAYKLNQCNDSALRSLRSINSWSGKDRWNWQENWALFLKCFTCIRWKLLRKRSAESDLHLGKSRLRSSSKLLGTSACNERPPEIKTCRTDYLWVRRSKQSYSYSLWICFQEEYIWYKSNSNRFHGWLLCEEGLQC